jgi:hypothetical protein
VAGATAAHGRGRRWQPSRTPALVAGSRPLLSSDSLVLAAALALGGAMVAGMALDAGPVVTLAAYLAILAGVVSPGIGLATLVFMATLKSPAMVPAPGFNSILVAAILLGCIYRLPIDRPQMRIGLPFLFLLGYVLYVAVQQLPEMASGYTGDEGHLVGYQFFQLLTGFGAVVAAALVLARRNPYPFVVAGLSSAVVAALLAAVTFDNPSAGAPFAGLVATVDAGTRAVGPFGNPNYFGLLEAMALGTAVGCMSITSGRLRLGLAAISIALGVGLVLSLSRGAAVALLAGLACLAFARNRMLGVTVVAIGLLVAVVVYPLFVEWRLSYTNGYASTNALAILAESDQGRLGAILAGPMLFLSSPLFGIGWGHYSFGSAQISGSGIPIAAHNWYVNTLAEEGAVGITLWMLLLVALAFGLRSRPSPAREIGFAALGAFAVGSLFLEPPTSFQVCGLPIVIVVAALVSNWSPAARSEPPGTSPRGAG